MKQQTEAEETQSEAEEYFETEQTKEVTKERMFRLPCFEAEEHFETEQTKEVSKKRIFRLPCFEAEETQSEVEERFETEQT